MASRKDIQSQIAALQAELDKDLEEHEVWIKEDGREYKVTGARAEKILGRWSDLWADNSESEETEETGETEEPPAEKKTYFRKK